MAKGELRATVTSGQSGAKTMIINICFGTRDPDGNKMNAVSLGS